MIDTDSDDANRYEYPPAWTPPGCAPPERRTYKPPLRSGCPDPLADQRNADDYPKEWRRWT